MVSIQLQNVHIFELITPVTIYMDEKMFFIGYSLPWKTGQQKPTSTIKEMIEEKHLTQSSNFLPIKKK